MYENSKNGNKFISTIISVGIIVIFAIFVIFAIITLLTVSKKTTDAISFAPQLLTQKPLHPRQNENQK